MAKSKTIKGRWSKSDINLLKKLFPNDSTARVAARFRRSAKTVEKKAYGMGLKKSRKYLKSLGRA